MEARDTSKLEFIKQPHIMALITILVICIVGALFTTGRRVNQTLQLSSMETFDACYELVNDEPLCKFAAKDEATADDSYVLSITTTSENSEEINIIKAENPKKTSSTTHQNGDLIDETIILGNEIYIKDYSDNVWAHYTEEAEEDTEETISYDFTSETSEDVQSFKDDHKFEAMEQCDDKMCYKYKITHDADTNSYSYLWFDDQEFLTRRILTVDTDTSTNMAFEYKAVTIDVPTPTKEISLEDLEEFLDTDYEL